MAKRVYVVEIIVDEPGLDENLQTWVRLGDALMAAGFDDVLYSGSFPADGDADFLTCGMCSERVHMDNLREHLGEHNPHAYDFDMGQVYDSYNSAEC